jgi:hypothetical protein
VLSKYVSVTVSHKKYLLIISRSIILIMKHVSDHCCRENQNERFKLNLFFFENRAVYVIMWESTADHRLQYGAYTLHAVYVGLQINTQSV